jgi:anti-sigma-K factor RskA
MSDTIHELSAGYAVDALDEEERRRFEAHLDDCARCRDDVDAFRTTAAGLAIADPSPPPPADLRRRILDAARAERPNVVPLRPRRRALWMPAAAVASAVAVAAGAWAVVLSNRVSDRDDTIAVLSDPSARRLALSDGVAGHAMLVVALSGDAALTGDFMPAPDGKEYEAWIITDRPQRAGMLGSGGRATLMLPKRLPKGATVAITLEREGGVDAPTSKPLATVRA